jgi:hypothetical protein
MIAKLGAFRMGYSTAVALAIMLGVTAVAFVASRFAWANWTLYAIAVTAFVLLGGVRFWPWGVERLRPIGVGLLLGLVAAVAEFLLSQVP